MLRSGLNNNNDNNWHFNLFVRFAAVFVLDLGALASLLEEHMRDVAAAI